MQTDNVSLRNISLVNLGQSMKYQLSCQYKIGNEDWEDFVHVFVSDKHIGYNEITWLDAVNKYVLPNIDRRNDV